MRRRKFLGAVAIAATGCGPRGSYRFFTDAEARKLDAMLACIIPSDDAPGAREAGVIHYIDRQLMRHFREHRKTYREGIAALVEPITEQNLRDMERDPQRRPFLDLVVTHAMQGFYGNPRHGGNRDFASWRMLGIPPLPVRGREGGSSAKS